MSTHLHQAGRSSVNPVIGVETPGMNGADAPSLTYGLRDAGELRGSLVMRGTRAQITSEPRTWEITGRDLRFSWCAVVYQRGAQHADAAYYPHLGSGGTIAFEAERYELRRDLIGGRWRLRGEHRQTVARLLKQRAPKHQDPLRLPRFTIELEPHARTNPDLWLLLLVAAWAILIEPQLVVPS